MIEFLKIIIFGQPEEFRYFSLSNLDTCIVLCWLQRVGIQFTSYKAFFVSNGSSNASILERFFFSKIDEANNNPIYFH